MDLGSRLDGFGFLADGHDADCNMTIHPSSEQTCSACGIALSSPAGACARCGKAVVPVLLLHPAAGAPKRSLREIADRRWLVVALLFGVTGVIGLPLLWISRSFSPFMKVVLAVAVTVYTALLVWAVYIILAWSWSRISPYVGA